MTISSSLLSRALDTMSEGSLITDADQMIVYANAAFVSITGYSEAEVLGINCRFLQDPETDRRTIADLRAALESGSSFRGDILNRRKNGSKFWNALTVSPLRDTDGVITHFVSVQLDVTEQIKLRFDTIHDQLTGLPNRMALSEYLERHIAVGRGSDRSIVVAILDLDHFSVINETLGRSNGDVVLREFAARVGTAIDEQDFVARVGGDSFAIVVDGINPVRAADRMRRTLDRVRQAIDVRFDTAEGKASVTVSSGTAVYPYDGLDEFELFRAADEELYEEKKAKAERARWWDHLPSLESKFTADAVPEDLALLYRQRIADGGLTMYVQPIVNLKTGAVPAVECLARLSMPSGEIVAAARFVPLLDTVELEQLFRFGLEQALSSLTRWDEAGLTMDITVNLDPSSLLNESCASWVQDALVLHDIAPERLILELLETRSVESKEQRVAIRTLRELGIRLAIDDLGSGFSNLQRLTNIEFDLIKIDAGMLAGFYAKPLETLSLVSALTQLSQDLGQESVVEGLEDRGLTGVAAVLGAPYGQGYFFAHPMPPTDIPEWIRAFRPPLAPTSIETYPSALAYHWRHGRLAAHPGRLEECDMTAFIDSHAGATGMSALHSDQHQNADRGETPDRANASGLMMDWLAQQVRDGAIA